ncbi:LOW QUALITY PROTEIN: THO complex subunit 2 [Drosophila serrata]|uniref:LOW QUALITY PROTEIN: THO complex subunit 2 n=1 Tax=Drosophila serrata TaxID=7274 RepID=UPI000A1D267F|nr:LOW QUALITY PROTEIN: THO complex subunit 2 [Drosophila serrata]
MRRLKKLKSVTGTQDGGDAAESRATTAASAETDANGGGGGGNGDAISGSGVAGSLNTDIFKHFDKAGRREFLKYLKEQLQDSTDGVVYDRNGVFKQGVSNAIYELLWQALRFTHKKDLVIHLLGEIVPLNEGLPSLIVDVINILDSETSLMTEGLHEERHAFVQLVKDMDKVVPESLLKERLEIDTLQDVGIVKNKSFYSKFIKVKTKLYYKQRRFNLFREESEGFAKLITELNQDFEDNTTPESIMDIIKSLIGCFNLDPNRVLDIIIESFETRPDRWQLFIPLLSSYMPTGAIICEVLGYKFCHFKDSRTPRTLYHVCALLLKHGVIQLDDVYVWLTPNDGSIKADWEQDLADAREMVRKLNLISTNKKDEDKDPPPPPSVKKFDEEKYSANQKFGLCEALLKVGDWENAYRIIQKLPEQAVVYQEPIARSIIDLIHFTVEQLYYKKCFKAPMGRKQSRSRLYDDAKLVAKMQAKDFGELRKYIWPMCNVLGPGMHLDTVLMYKVVRIMNKLVVDMGVDSMNGPPPNSEAEQHYYDIMTCMDACILPSLLYLDNNCSMSELIWGVLKYFPYHYRYSLYARWKNDSYQLHPNLIRRCGLAQRDIKALMKRVSKENVKQLGRQVGKYSHCAPGLLFDYILLQIQIYDNLIGPVCDMLKYLTALSFDCLGYCIIESLTLTGRLRFKDDGTSLSLWLQSLASFCGTIFKKYNIELSGLLQYVANQLKSQKSLDLLILREIVHKMAGVESCEEMTNDQLQAMCGGEQLRGEAGYFSQVRNTKKSSSRLKDALANNDLAVALCLLMAQQKHCVIYRETAAHSHLKLVGNLYDQCQDTLVQFGTFLGSTYSVDEYVERLPSIITMLREYHINTDVAFFLARPMFTHQINQKYDQLRRADPNAKKLNPTQKLQKYLEATQLIMNPIVESVRPLHSLKVWEDISPQFLVTFWSLSMYDLHVPNDSYQREIGKLKQLAQQAADGKDSNQSKNKKEQERYIALMEKLNDERKKQHEHVDKILQRLQEQKDGWFLLRSAKSAKNDTITQFLQLCLFPRCTFTALDALYCAKFVHTIHNLKTSNFATLLCYDRIFCDITYSVTSCTEGEATRYGRFLCAMLETVMRWHADQAVFNKECANYPGFVTKFRVSNQFSEANDHVGYENYRHVCHKWHYKITKAIVFCLDSKDFMQIRNALIILMRILPHYPVLAKLAQIIERKVDKVREEEKTKRPDLYVIASSYIGQLKLKTPHMFKESDFHQMAERPGNNSKESPQGVGGDSGSTTIKVLSLEKDSIPTAIPSQAASGGAKSAGGSAATIYSNDPKPGSSKEQDTKTAPLTRNDSKGQKSEGPTAASTASLSTSISASINDRDSKQRDLPAPRESQSRHRDEQLEQQTNNGSNGSSRQSAESRGRDVDRDRQQQQEQEQRHGSSHRSSRETVRIKERTEAEQHQRSRERSQRLESEAAAQQRALKREKSSRRGGGGGNEERHRHGDGVETVDLVGSTDQRHYEEYEGRMRDRDLSSVSNESNGSLQHRQRSHETIEYEKDSKRRKLESSSSSSKKVEELVDSVKKARGIKTKERNKDKLSEEERDARKDRKMGRKRDRAEESNSSEHKRRREAQNGEDEQLREREQRHRVRKIPRERSHEKFDRERGAGGGGGGAGGSSSRGEDRQYSISKSTRSSRVNY